MKMPRPVQLVRLTVADMQTAYVTAKRETQKLIMKQTFPPLTSIFPEPDQMRYK